MMIKIEEVAENNVLNRKETDEINHLHRHLPPLLQGVVGQIKNEVLKKEKEKENQKKMMRKRKKRKRKKKKRKKKDDDKKKEEEKKKRLDAWKKAKKSLTGIEQTTEEKMESVSTPPDTSSIPVQTEGNNSADTTTTKIDTTSTKMDTEITSTTTTNDENQLTEPHLPNQRKTMRGEDDDLEDVEETAPAPKPEQPKDEDDEIDPLDAFMFGIAEQVKKEKTEDDTNNNTQQQSSSTSNGIKTKQQLQLLLLLEK